MATPKFDNTITLGNTLTIISIFISVGMVWVNLTSSVAQHTVQISALKEENAKRDSEQLLQRAEIRGLINDVKTDLKEVKSMVIDRLISKGDR